MRISRNLLGISLTFSAMAWAADPALLNLVMPEAKLIAGVNVERILASPIGKEMSAKIRGAAPQFQQIFNDTGFDPMRDLKEIVIAATGQGQNSNALILVRGSFDAAKFHAFAAGSGQKAVNYEGVSIFGSPGPKSGSMALLDDGLAIGGDSDQVRAAIRRRKHMAPMPAELAARIAGLSERYDIWFQSNGSLMPPSSKVANANLQPASDLLKAIDQVSGGMKFGSGLDLAAELVARTEKDAVSTRDALQLLTGLMTMNQQKAGGLRPDALKLSVEGKTIRIAVSLTEEELKKAYEQRMARAGGQDVEQPSEAKKQIPADAGLVIQSSDKDMGTVNVPASR